MSTVEFNDRVERLTSSKMMELVLEKARSQLTVANDEETSSKEESLFVNDATQQIIHNLERGT
jgi:hypothetical protein